MCGFTWIEKQKGPLFVELQVILSHLEPYASNMRHFKMAMFHRMEIIRDIHRISMDDHGCFRWICFVFSTGAGHIFVSYELFPEDFNRVHVDNNQRHVSKIPLSDTDF